MIFPKVYRKSATSLQKRCQEIENLLRLVRQRLDGIIPFHRSKNDAAAELTNCLPFITFR